MGALANGGERAGDGKERSSKKIRSHFKSFFCGSPFRPPLARRLSCLFLFREPFQIGAKARRAKPNGAEEWSLRWAHIVTLCDHQKNQNFRIFFVSHNVVQCAVEEFHSPAGI